MIHEYTKTYLAMVEATGLLSYITIPTDCSAIDSIDKLRLASLQYLDTTRATNVPRWLQLPVAIGE